MRGKCCAKKRRKDIKSTKRGEQQEDSEKEGKERKSEPYRHLCVYVWTCVRSDIDKDEDVGTHACVDIYTYVCLDSTRDVDVCMQE